MARILRIAGCAALVPAVTVGAFGARVEAGSGSAASPAVYRTWRTFTDRDGLPDASIRAIRVVDGAVWVGTDAGLARRTHDGWSSWNSADGLPEAPISAIELDPRTGDLWLGTWGGGVVRFTGGRFDRFTQLNSGLAGDLIFDLAVAEGRVWIAGNGGVSVLEPLNGDWELYLEVRADVAVPAATDLLVTEAGMHAGTWSGPLLRLDPGRGDWVTVGPAPVAAPADALGGETALAVGRGGSRLWWTSRGRLLRSGRGGAWPGRRFDRPACAPGFVTGLAARSDGEAWLGSSDGLQVLFAGKRPTWVLYDVAPDRSEGSVTVVRAGQVVEFRRTAPALPDRRIRCVAFEDDGVWVGTPRGLALGTSRTPWAGPEPAASAEARPVAHGPTGPTDTSTMWPDTAGAAWREREVRIGVLGPFTRPVSLPGAASPWPTRQPDRVAVARAAAGANRRQTGQDRVFTVAENLVSFARYGWITAQDSFAMLRDQYRVHALVGSIEPEARMDAAVALRTGLPVVNIASTDPTLDESLHPWIYRCAENDPRWQLRLLDFVFDSLGHTRPAVLRTPGAESESRLERWVRHAGSRGHVPVADLIWDPDEDDLSAQTEGLRRSRADVLLTWADARSTARLVRGLRAAGSPQLVLGSGQIIDSEFLELVGPEPGAVIALARCPHFEVAGDAAAADGELLEHRPGLSRKPELPQSGPSFTAAAHLIVAIELAGTEPEAIRRSLAAMGRPRVARLREGEWVIEELQAAGRP